MKRVITAFLVGLAVVVSLTACGADKCLEGHFVTTWLPYFNGKTTALAPQFTYICDLREGKADVTE